MLKPASTRHAWSGASRRVHLVVFTVANVTIDVEPLYSFEPKRGAASVVGTLQLVNIREPLPPVS